MQQLMSMTDQQISKGETPESLEFVTGPAGRGITSPGEILKPPPPQLGAPPAPPLPPVPPVPPPPAPPTPPPVANGRMY